MELMLGVLVVALGAVVTVMALRSGRGRTEAVDEVVRRAAEDGARRAAAEQSRLLIEQSQALLTGERALLDKHLDAKESVTAEQVAAVHGQMQLLTESVQRLEREGRAAQAGLGEQVRALHQAQELLRVEAGNLATALRSPTTRGRWGEMQLRRAIELAGMLQHCDFTEQRTVLTEDRMIRPDVIVHLPGAKTTVVDAKVPLHAFLEAIEAKDEETARERMMVHARQTRKHVDALASKAYWEQLPSTPDFVVMFVPGDQLLAAAMDHDPALMEHAIASRVLIATPVTLIALLRAVAYGWQQEALAENARQIADVGRQLQDRLGTFAGHLGKVGRSLDSAVGAYNEAVGSYESRVMVSARRLGELEVGDKELNSPEPVDRRARALPTEPRRRGGVVRLRGTDEPDLPLEAEASGQ